MNKHWKGVLAILLVASLAFGIAMGVHQPLWAMFGLVLAIVVGYVMAIDWMRPRKPSNSPDGDSPRMASSPRP
ncbi:MAG: hypothetical protein QM756_14615 [Polyangiaceae bacterium]